MNQSDKQEFNRLTRNKAIATALFLIGLFAISGFLSLFFKPEVQMFANWLDEKLGFSALAALLFFSDWFISPFPPDVVLFVVANSRLQENWLVYVSLISLISTFAGHAGWLMGKTIVEKPWAPRWIKALPDKNKGLLRKYGPVIVALGAATPLPFSITCWTAGFLKMRWKRFAIASLFRIPRIFIAYWAIYYSQYLRSLLNLP